MDDRFGMPRQLSLYTNMRGLVREQCPSFHQWLDLELLRPNDKGLFFFREVGGEHLPWCTNDQIDQTPETRMEQPVELGNAAAELPADAAETSSLAVP